MRTESSSGNSITTSTSIVISVIILRNVSCPYLTGIGMRLSRNMRPSSVRSVSELNKDSRVRDVDWAYATYDQLRTDLFERVVADSGAFLASVEARQVGTFESALRKDNAKTVRLIQAPAPERLNKRAQETLDLVQDWLGRLTKEQQAQIREWSFALPDVEPMWVAYQQQRRHELVTLLHQSRTPERIAR